MSYDPISYLGLSCPSGGDFYICQGSETRFLGCCDIDPCDENGCPSSAVHPASFNANRYSEIPAESCASSSKPSLWYTCTNGPTFLGCCSSNPCNNEGVCPEDDLVGAALDDDPSKASVFLTIATATSTSSPSTLIPPTTPTSTSSSNRSTSTPASSVIPATPTPSPASAPANQRISRAGIVGGVLGGLVVLGLIVFLFFRCRRRKGRALATAPTDEDGVATSQPPWSPYHDSFCSSLTVPPTGTISPFSQASTHHRSISASLSSIIGFKRAKAAKRRSSQISDDREAIAGEFVRSGHDNGQTSPRFLNLVAELESPLPGGILVRGPLNDRVYYELEGSIPEPELREMAS
ncbi:hypothetical protein HD806DRAFT_43456 [Xylariaceae sp. AK1471]|nr:hypothetical protein HD806DRAFT_43456 [Xylariaceae sp. AK1471]